MFLLYAVALGLVAGLVLGGRPAGLAGLRLRWPGLALGGLLAQVVLFTDAVAARVGDLGPALYVATTAMVLASLVRNWRVPGMPLVVLGALSNMAAILANGGYMPAGQAALAALGKAEPVVYSNSSVVPQPALEPLTDIFALPPWLPGANIFSIGDVLIGVGIALVIVLAMRRPTVTGLVPSGVIPEPDAGGGASAH
jgi:hypothetical protein